MNSKEIIKEVKKYLPKYLINDSSFKQIINTFLNIAKNSKIYIEVSNEIFDNIEESKLKGTDICTSNAKNRILKIYSSELEVALAIFLTDKYEILFSKTIKEKNNLYKEIEIEIRIDKSGATWKVSETLEDEKYYCLDYKAEFYRFDQYGESEKIYNLENAKDEDFFVKFGVPEEKIRECRLNFKDNIEYINDCKKTLKLKILDEEVEYDRSQFTIPFEITNFATFVSGIINNTEETIEKENDEDESYEEENEDSYEKEEENYDYSEEPVMEFAELNKEDIETLELEEIYTKAYNIQETLINQMGYDGKFVMSQNMYQSIENYINGKDDKLITTGSIIRKKANKFTIYYTHLTEESVVIIPHEASREEITELYKKDPMNECIIGLSEFFEISKNYKLEKDN